MPPSAKPKAAAARGRGWLRIIGGKWRGRKIAVPDSDTLRPTHERAREAIFNRLLHAADVLGVGLRDARVADVFAGTGALGFEALSRGAATVTFVEFDRGHCAAITTALKTLISEDTADVVCVDATALPRAAAPFDIVLMDPPYGKGLATPALESLSACGWLRAGTLIVTELDSSDPLSLPAGFTLIDQRAYGRASIAYMTWTS
jgi:16S rRNA (guanine966-N2)-methyltransferase